MIRRLASLSFALLIALTAASPAASKQSSGSKSGSSTSTKSSSKATTSAPKKKSEPVEAFAADEGGIPKVRASSAIVIDASTGRILHEVNADQQRQVASTQKLLTALIIAESGGFDSPVEVQESDTWAEPSKLYIKPGDVYRRGDLLRILLVKSMNDVARCLARDNAGSLESFAAKMNAKAAQLGMTESHFVNPNGLPAPGQYSTARDMAKVAYAAYRNRSIRELVRLKETTWKYPNGKTEVFKNTNKVLRNYALCNGMKTGYTEAAGHCLISSAANSGREVIVVVLGDVRDAVWVDSYKLLSWGLSS